MKIQFIILFAFVVIHAQEPESIIPKPPKGMVYVPAGNFIMGSKYGDPDERPQHIAYTDAYFIDKYEVSNFEYSQFDPKFEYKEGKENSPAIVNWSQANAYA